MRLATTSPGIALSGKRHGLEALRVNDHKAAWRERIASLAAQSDRAYLVALRATGSPALAEEAVQEAYAWLCEHLPEDRGESAGIGYFLQVVRGKAFDLAKTTRHRKKREENYTVTSVTMDPSPLEQAVATETARAARRELEQLPQEEREAVSLCCEQDLPWRVVSEVLSVPERTVADRMRRGLEKLRQSLAAQGFASVTPLVLENSLRGLGVPPGPSGLAQSIGSDVRVASRSVRRSHRLATAKTSSTTVATMAVVMGLAAVAVGAWMLAKTNRTAGVSSKPATSLAPAAPETSTALTGYGFEDSDHPGGPVYSWIDISTTGTPISGLGNNAIGPFYIGGANVGPFNIGFDFPFYGKLFKTFRVCSSGWLSFTSTSTSDFLLRVPDANPDSVENLVAFFFLQLNFNTGGSAYYQQIDAETLVVQFEQVPIYSNSSHARITCEAILKADGTVVFQYKNLGFTSALVGIQNETRDAGLLVCDGLTTTKYLHSGLAVRIKSGIGAPRPSLKASSVTP